MPRSGTNWRCEEYASFWSRIYIMVPCHIILRFCWKKEDYIKFLALGYGLESSLVFVFPCFFKLKCSFVFLYVRMFVCLCLLCISINPLDCATSLTTYLTLPPSFWMDNLRFVSNNCNGLATSDKDRIKFFLYLQNAIKKNGILFLQETHSTKDTANKFCKDFGNENESYFSHGASLNAG